MTSVKLKTLFRLPGVFLAWGLGDGDWTPEAIVNTVADAGFRWICQEMGSPDGRADPNPGLITRLRTACHSRAVYYGTWEVSPRDLTRFDAAKPNFWVLNVESDHYDYGPLLQQFRAAHPKLPAGVITNCDFDQAPFLAANVKIIPEAYQPDNPVATPTNMVNRAKSMGYTYAFPCVGVYHNYPLASYVMAGNGYSVYLAEEMQPDDWQVATALNPRYM